MRTSSRNSRSPSAAAAVLSPLNQTLGLGSLSSFGGLGGGGTGNARVGSDGHCATPEHNASCNPGHINTLATNVMGDHQQLPGHFSPIATRRPSENDGASAHGYPRPSFTTTVNISSSLSSLSPPPTPRLTPVPLPSLTGGIVPTLSGVLHRRGLLGFDFTQANIAGYPRRGPTAANEWRYTPATSPSTSCMTLRIPQVGCYITVHASSSHGMVTVGDVIATVHKRVRSLVSEEWYWWARENVASSMRTTSSAVCWPSYYDGLTWLVLLGEYQHWAGLALSSTERDVWDLMVER